MILPLTSSQIRQQMRMGASRMLFVGVCGLLVGAETSAPDSATSIITELLHVSPAIAAMGYFIMAQHKSLRESEKDRAQDSATVRDRMLDQADKWNKTLSGITQVIETNNEGMRELKGAIQDLRNDRRKNDT